MIYAFYLLCSIINVIVLFVALPPKKGYALSETAFIAWGAFLFGPFITFVALLFLFVFWPVLLFD